MVAQVVPSSDHTRIALVAQADALARVTRAAASSGLTRSEVRWLDDLDAIAEGAREILRVWDRESTPLVFEGMPQEELGRLYLTACAQAELVRDTIDQLAGPIRAFVLDVVARRDPTSTARAVRSLDETHGAYLEIGAVFARVLEAFEDEIDTREVNAIGAAELDPSNLVTHAEAMGAARR